MDGLVDQGPVEAHAEPPPARAGRAGAVRRAAFAWTAACLLGAALRIYPGDLLRATEWLLLAPFPAAMLAMLPAAPFLPGGRRAVGVALGAMLLLQAASCVREQPRLLSAGPLRNEAVEGAVRLTAWNVMSFNRGREEVLSLYEADDPDILCLLEGTYRGAPPDFLVRRMGRGYNWASTRQMALASRYPLGEYREIRGEEGVRALRAEVRAPDGPFVVILVHLPSPPRANTRALMRELWAILQLEDGPFVLVGDFNSPRGSLAKARMARDLVDFHAAAGPRGWLASWHSHFPMWQIDYAYAGPGIQPLWADLPASKASDHHRVRIGFRRAAD